VSMLTQERGSITPRVDRGREEGLGVLGEVTEHWDCVRLYFQATFAG